MVAKHMLESFFGTIGALAANKKVVGAWLVLLSMSVATIGDKVYVQRTAELAVVENQLKNIQTTLDKMDKTLEANRHDLQLLLIEQARVRTELEVRKVARK